MRHRSGAPGQTPRAATEARRSPGAADHLFSRGGDDVGGRATAATAYGGGLPSDDGDCWTTTTTTTRMSGIVARLRWRPPRPRPKEQRLVPYSYNGGVGVGRDVTAAWWRSPARRKPMAFGAGFVLYRRRRARAAPLPKCPPSLPTSSCSSRSAVSTTLSPPPPPRCSARPRAGGSGTRPRKCGTRPCTRATSAERVAAVATCAASGCVAKRLAKAEGQNAARSAGAGRSPPAPEPTPSSVGARPAAALRNPKQLPRRRNGGDGRVARRRAVPSNADRGSPLPGLGGGAERVVW